jgi:Mlc titration factor MtfA (ptsG expression regulator)
LRDLALLFLNEKAIEEAAGVQLDQRMRLLIALQAFYRQDPIERLAPT